MFCKNCGKESTNGQKFCTSCGTPFSTQSSTPKQPHVADYTTSPAATHTTKPPINRHPMPKEPWTTGKITKTVLAVVFVGGLILLKFGMAAINSVDNSAVEKNNAALDNFNSGNSDQAIAGFQQATKDAVTNTNKLNSLKNLAYVYSSEGKDDLALSTFEEALELASVNSFDYYMISGEIALLHGKSNSALLSFNKAYAMEPDNFQINNTLNLFYLDLNEEAPQYSDYPKALTYALKAYNNDSSKSSAATQNLGIAYFFNEQYDNAITYLKMSDVNKEPYIALWLGLAYTQKDQVATAKYYFNIAIKAGVDVPQEVTDYMSSN